MSLNALNKRIDSVHEEMTREALRIQEEIALVGRDPNLSPAGRAAKIDELKDILRAKKVEMKAREDQMVDETMRDLQRRVLGSAGRSPDAVIAYRDAQERAARIEDRTDALDAMRRAVISDDAGLAQAILNRALDAGWGGVAELYAEHYPAIADAVTDLATLTMRQNDTMNILLRSMRYGGV